MMMMMVAVPLGTRQVLGNPHLEAPRMENCALLKETGLVRVWAARHLLLRDQARPRGHPAPCTCGSCSFTWQVGTFIFQEKPKISHPATKVSRTRPRQTASACLSVEPGVFSSALLGKSKEGRGP